MDFHIYKNKNMLDVLPIELIEKIMLYLTVAEIYTFFKAFNITFSILPDHFWRKICLKEDFIQVSENQKWFECFESGINKVLGYFVHFSDTPTGKLEHIYSRSLIVREGSTNSYNVYNLTHENKFELVQKIPASSVDFKDEFVLAQKETKVIIYKYDWDLNKFEFLKSVSENIYDIFGISSKYCTVFHPAKKMFTIYSLCNLSEQRVSVLLPDDVKFVIDRILHLDNIVISTVTFRAGYRIKVYNFTTTQWILDLNCFSSTGITNDPNVWVGENFIACCDISYRLRGIYFGPFKVWNKQGEKLFEADIEPSNKHYLRCFFKDEHVLLTTSDKCIKTFNSFGQNISNLHTKTSFEDIKLSTAYLLFVLANKTHSVEIYNWKASYHLFSLPLINECSKSLFSDFLYCPYSADNKYEVFKFY